MVDQIWKLERGTGPLVATAIHDGHEVREEVGALLSLTDENRRREEDPYTAEWVRVAPTQVIVCRSRFEVDLNRARARAVYRVPADAWDLELWKEPPGDALIERSLEEYDAFYEAMHRLFEDLEREYGRFVVLDLHSYNHRRAGPDGAPADARENPQVNVGTGTLDRERWGRLVDGFVRDLSSYEWSGGRLDVRENVKFRGGQFSRWAHETFPRSACVLAIEFKKFFMDEWTGDPDWDAITDIRTALASTVPGILAQLQWE